MPTSRQRVPRYGPAKLCPPVGTRVAYHGSVVELHGIYTVVGNSAGCAVLLLDQRTGAIFTVPSGNREITSGHDRAGLIEEMLPAAARELVAEISEYLATR